MTVQTDFLPKRDADFALWATNMSQRLAAGGLNPFGLLPAQVTAFQALYGAWTAAWQAASQNITRTPTTIQMKDDARENLTNGVNGIRQLVKIIQANPATTNGDRENLQITVPDPEPSPVPIPAFAPGIEVTLTGPTTVKVRLKDMQNPENRGRPDGVFGAAVLTAVGSAPPALDDADAWTWRGNTTRTTMEVDLPGDTPPGTTVWITACWFNTRADTGPVANAVNVNLPGTLLQEAA